MECKYCGKIIPDKYNGKYCPKCYAELEGELPYTAMTGKGNANKKTEKEGEN